MKNKMICLPSEDVHNILLRWETHLVEQENELRHQRKNLDEIKAKLRVKK